MSYIYIVSRCGSGLSGEVLTEAGHCWVGVDISQHMLSQLLKTVKYIYNRVSEVVTSPLSPAVAQEREVEGDLFLQDMGDGLGFRAGTFDGMISVSALQWLCNADKKTHHPPRRLYRFFSSLYACMVYAIFA